jgi:hypothetical protein
LNEHEYHGESYMDKYSEDENEPPDHNSEHGYYWKSIPKY